MKDDGHLTLWILIPALLGWIGYGLCWLLNPHLGGGNSPLEWAGYAVAGYYLIATASALPFLFL